MTTETMSIITQLDSNVALSEWSDDRRKEFKDTFEQRTSAHRFILEAAAEYIAETALKKHYVGQAHLKNDYFSWGYSGPNFKRIGAYGDDSQVGGRAVNDLLVLAKERAEKILRELPPVRNAVRVISVDLANKMDRLDVLQAQGTALKEKLEIESTPIDMSELDQKITIGAFRKMVEDREERRIDLLKQLDKLGREGRKLDDEVNRRLFKGIPGLANAVMAVVEEHFERAKAIEETKRRVGEFVMFGDSDAAMSLLKKFEEDELKVSMEIKADFDAAMAKLKLIKTKGKLPKEFAK